VAVFCHSQFSGMARFLFHAQDHNMTNGDFVFFTFHNVRRDFTDRPWIRYNIDPEDFSRRLRAFYVVKQVHFYYAALVFLLGYCKKTFVDRLV